MRNSYKVILCSLISIWITFFACTATAQTDFWQQTNGPYGGDIRALAINNDEHIFAGTFGSGVFRSADNGENWSQTGLTNTNVQALAINSNGHIFAGIFFLGDGVFRSIDNGDNWSQTGLTSYSVMALAINSNGHIFAGTLSAGVFHSTDNGDTWNQINTGLTKTYVLTLTINENGHIFAGTNGGIFRSTDNGGSWSEINTGLTNRSIQALAINSDGVIYVGTNGGGVFRSLDNGDSWSAINIGLTNSIVFALAINNDGHIFAGTNFGGVFRSTNNGDNWSPINTGLNYTLVQRLTINKTGHIFAGTGGGGVFRSTNSGANWSQINIGLTASKVEALVINSNQHIFAGTNGAGVFRSTDNGNNWNQINTGLTVFDVRALAINNNGHIFAAIFGNVFRSTDNGDIWNPTSLGSGTFAALTINNQGHIFAGSAFNGVFRSIDNGESWSQINTGLTSRNVLSLAINNNNGYIFAGTGDGGVFRSTNNGNNWSLINSGLTNLNVIALAINNSNGHIFAGAYYGGVFRSTDNGDSWSAIGLPNTLVYALTINNSNGHIFAGTDGGVFRSTNNGMSWNQSNGGLTNTNVRSLALNSVGHIFAGTDGGGVFRLVPGNRPPVVMNAISDQTLKVCAAAFTRDLNAAPAIFNDPDGDALIYNASSSDTNKTKATVSGSILTIEPLAAGLVTITIIANDGKSGPVSTKFAVTIQANQSPDIAHTPASLQPNGQQIPVQANITDDTGVARVTLNYRRGGDPSFTSLAMTSTGDNYNGLIPASVVTSRGVEYYIEASDQCNLAKRSELFSVRVMIGEPGVTSDGAQPHGNSQTAYRLFSVPIDLDNKNPQAVLEDDLGKYDDTKWRFSELVANQTHVEFPNTTVMTAGKAFWLLVKDAGKIIDTDAGRSNATHQTFKIALHAEWNFVGNPFNFPIPLNNNKISLKSGKPLVLRFYNGSWNDPAISPINSFLPFEGYAVFISSSDTLLVDPDLTAGSGAFRRTSSQEAQSLKGSRQALWSIRILAQCQEARDVDNTAAIIAGASKNYDEWDQPEPPIIGEYVSVYFPHRDWEPPTPNYCADARPEFSHGEIWEFEVTTNIRDKVDLTFDGIEQVPAEFAVWVVDEALSLSQNLREKSSYSVAGSNHSKRLKLVVGRQDFIADKLSEIKIIPASYELSQNFPNPFNPATTIRYGLPEAERVTLKVFNLLGEEVVTLIADESKEAGYHTAIWNGRNQTGQSVASGVYVYRLRAGSLVMTKKMALVQ